MIHGGATIAVVEHRDGAMHIDSFRTRLEAVKAILASGTLADDCFGGPCHKRALNEVVAEVLAITESIKRMEAEEAAALDADPLEGGGV